MGIMNVEVKKKRVLGLCVFVGQKENPFRRGKTLRTPEDVGLSFVMM